MKFKNNYPGKIWAKSDHWFQSYGQKCIKNRLLGTVLEPDQLPGSRLTGFYQLPGSENRNRPIPRWDPRNPSDIFLLFQVALKCGELLISLQWQKCPPFPPS